MLVVTSSEGCIDTIIKPITIYPQLLIFIPNAFTPDNNGLNDIWMPTITGFDTETFDMSIYDRWGKEIFKSLDLHQGWNGKGSDGKICMEGVFTYIIYITDLRGKEHKIMGHVSIIR
jgi:gliding motility-associated-like protein